MKQHKAYTQKYMRCEKETLAHTSLLVVRNLKLEPVHKRQGSVVNMLAVCTPITKPKQENKQWEGAKQRGCKDMNNNQIPLGYGTSAGGGAHTEMRRCKHTATEFDEKPRDPVCLHNADCNKLVSGRGGTDSPAGLSFRKYM